MRRDDCLHVYGKILTILNEFKRETSPQLPNLVEEVLVEFMETILCS